MNSNQLIYFSIWILIALCAFTGIGMAFYLGRSKIKKVDLLVHGYEIPEDSIFFYGLRLMNYGGAFAWRFGAKRSKLLYIREKFDKKFQRPFIVYFCLMMSSGFSMILLFIWASIFYISHNKLQTSLVSTLVGGRCPPYKTEFVCCYKNL